MPLHTSFNSHRLVDTVLLVEKELSKKFPADKIYQTDANGNAVKNQFNQQLHSPEYAKAYYDAFHGMVEKQMRDAIIATSNFWYTAWVNARKPNVADLDPAELTK